MFSFAFEKISVIICNNRIIKTFNMTDYFFVIVYYYLYIVILFIVTLFKQKTNITISKILQNYSK